MNKIKSLALVFISIITLFSFTGCGDKNPISADDFKSKMEEKGYTVVEATEQFTDFDYVKKVYLAVDKDTNYQMEFYQLDNEKNAKGFFASNQKIIEDSKGKITKFEISISGGNNEKYTLRTEGKYKYVSRIENTVIYFDVDEKYKDDIDEILDEIDY